MTNPLAKHFRQPAIYLAPPSKGEFWPENAINIPVNGELGICPLTTKDEITLRTPDALMNGSGVVEVIQSCVPEITNAWEMPSVDVDAIIIAIRIASYGHMMDVDSKCPKCGHDNQHVTDLRAILDNIKCPDYRTPVELDGLKIFLKPKAYFEVNKANQIEFTEEQLLRSLRDPNLTDDVKVEQMKAHMARLLELNYNSLVASTNMIITENGEVVSDPKFLKEFYQLSKSAFTKAIQHRIKEMSDSMTIKPMTVTCSGVVTDEENTIECGHQYQVQLTFDYANFFDLGF